jgi:hypothetical protein
MPRLTRTLPIVAATAWLLAAPASAKPPSKTHLGTKASDHVTLVTEPSATQAGEVAPLSFALDRAGGPLAAFTLPAGTALVVTDVSVSMPSNAPPGRYTAALCDTPRTLPQFDTAGGNGTGMVVEVHGYLLKSKERPRRGLCDASGRRVPEGPRRGDATRPRGASPNRRPR